MNLLAAAGAADSPVRHVVVKSSTVVYGSSATDPATFSEDHARTSPPRTRLERSLTEAEQLIRGLRRGQPVHHGDGLRFANVLGTDIVTSISKNLSRPLFPTIFGYDPLIQFVEEDDVVRALEFVTRQPVPACSTWPAPVACPGARSPPSAGPGPLPLPPINPRRAIAPLVRLGPSTSRPSSRPCCATAGASTTAGCSTSASSTATPAPGRSRASSGASACAGAGRPPVAYKYEHDVEQFFRHSPSVVQPIEP